MPDQPTPEPSMPEPDRAPASAPPSEPGEPTPTGTVRAAPIGWRELVRDFLKPGRAQVVFAAILLICGLGVALQVRAQSEQADYSSLRHDELVQLLDDLSAQSRRLEAEIADLEQTGRQLRSGADSEQVAREEAQRRLDVLSVLGGTAPAQGPGITITINDPQRKVTAELLLNTVEEMRDAGAEVIAINGTIRVVASTWFGSDADGLLVDGRRVVAPIVIDVIGEPHALAEAAQFSGGVVSHVTEQRIGGTVTIVDDALVTVTAVIVPTPNRFAKPV